MYRQTFFIFLRYSFLKLSNFLLNKLNVHVSIKYHMKKKFAQ